MSDGLIKKLRSREYMSFPGGRPVSVPDELCQEAADALARARGALREIVEYYLDAGIGYTAEDVYKIARAALASDRPEREG